MHVKQVMQSRVKTCGPADPASKAAQLMWEGDFGCVPVVDGDGCFVGMITDRDLCMAAFMQGKPLAEIPVESAMSRTAWSVRPEDGLEAVDTLLAEKQIRRVPVTDGRRRVVGIVSLNDLACLAASERSDMRRNITDAEVGVVVSAISARRSAEEPDSGTIVAGASSRNGG